MYIIDKNKDYYDYISHLYGVDKKITYDRRGSKIITDLDVVESSFVPSFRDPSRDSEFFVILEVGYTQYLIKLTDFTFKQFDATLIIDGCTMKLVRMFKDNKHYYKYPVSIRGVYLQHYWHRKKGYQFKIDGSYQELIKRIIDSSIHNPILKGTQITSLIPPEEIWAEVQNYISSLGNDKDVSLLMTDVEKAETHGFDRITSFRNPIK